jgi:dihydroorotase
MTLYITPETNATTVTEACKSGIVHAFKLYPAGATTNSAAGVDQIESLYPLFEAMQDQGMPLVYSWRGDGPRHRYFRSRGAFY